MAAVAAEVAIHIYIHTYLFMCKLTIFVTIDRQQRRHIDAALLCLCRALHAKVYYLHIYTYTIHLATCIHTYVCKYVNKRFRCCRGCGNLLSPPLPNYLSFIFFFNFADFAFIICFCARFALFTVATFGLSAGMLSTPLSERRR